MSNHNSILKVKNIATRFLTQDGVVHAVNGVSFNLKRGELLGGARSRCGKDDE